MQYGKTQIILCQDEHDLGHHAATGVAETMRGLLAQQDEVRLIFAAGESQNTFFTALATQPNLDWSRVVCFNMDDFWDPRIPDRFTCGYQTRTMLYDHVEPRRFEQVRANAPDAQAEARRFADLIQQLGRFDIACMGIGTSGHLALNEPGDTDFDDLEPVRVVDLAEQSKRQLIDDPNFKALGYIPDKGITMTLPTMLAAKHLFTIVPLALKRDILTRVLSTPEPTTDLPATILSRHEGTLFVDRNSCPTSLMQATP